jgi:hypothetical protein
MQTSLWNDPQLWVMQGIFRHLTALDLGQHHLAEGE